jgi:hypothetical protein
MRTRSGVALGHASAWSVNWSAERVARPAEDGEDAVALAAALDDRAAVPGDAGRDQRIVAGQGPPHHRRVLFPEGRTPLNVGEQECHRLGR